VLRGGVLHGKSLHSGITAEEGTHLGGDFGKRGVVVIIEVGARLPESGTGELSRHGIKRFDVLDEAGLGLNSGDESSVEQGAELLDFRGSYVASDYASNHEYLLRRMGEMIRRG
jgi:hypothetical protein